MIGLAIAATSDKDDLSSFGGNAGAVLFERSREAPEASSPDTHSSRRRRITLAEGPPRQLSPIEDEADFLAAEGIA